MFLFGALHFGLCSVLHTGPYLNFKISENNFSQIEMNWYFRMKGVKEIFYYFKGHFKPSIFNPSEKMSEFLNFTQSL